MDKYIVVFSQPHHTIQSRVFDNEDSAKTFKAEHPLGKFASVLVRAGANAEQGPAFTEAIQWNS